MTRLTQISVLLLITMLALCPFALAGTGLEAYKAKNWPEALRAFQAGAQKGDAEAMHYLGRMYYLAQGVKQDYVKAADYWRRAAAKGYAGSSYNLGVVYRKGRGVAKDPRRALDLFNKAANRGSGAAANAVGEMISSGTPWKNYEFATYAFEKGARLGHAGAMNNLGVAYLKGWNRRIKDYKIKAYVWLKRAEAKGQKNAAYNLAFAAKKLSAEEMTEARRLLAQPLPKPVPKPAGKRIGGVAQVTDHCFTKVDWDKTVPRCLGLCPPKTTKYPRSRELCREACLDAAPLFKKFWDNFEPHSYEPYPPCNQVIRNYRYQTSTWAKQKREGGMSKKDADSYQLGLKWYAKAVKDLDR